MPGNNKGFIFLEILIAIALMSIVFIALLGIGFLSLNISTALQRTAQADAYAKETMEGVRAFRDGTTWATDGLGTLSTGSSNPYYPNLNTSTNPATWEMQAGSQTVGIFTRRVVFDTVYRDGGGNIAESGTLDANTLKVTVTVLWDNTSTQLVTYMTNWK